MPVGTPSAGVVLASPSVISDSLKRQVDAVLAQVPADKKAALVTVATTKGFNVAFAYRVGDRLKVASWVGKSGWDQPLDAGVSVTATFD